jgi:hypothetical protein
MSAVGTEERRKKTREMARKECGLAWLILYSGIKAVNDTALVTCIQCWNL